ncbi:MAG: tRNA (guanosine(37)-N1)-methyltransferase TrmD, partial [Leptospirales bacterium]
MQLRDFADPGRKGRVDETPYGGGPGMVLQPGPIDRGLQSMPEKYPVALMTPRGELLGQRRVREFAGMRGLTIVCGYYEGVDERVAEHLVDYQVSIGEFVLGSGDLAALCLIEAVTRLLPGYMGSADSHRVESYESATMAGDDAEDGGWR